MQYLLDLAGVILTKVAEFHQVFLFVLYQFAQGVDLAAFRQLKARTDRSRSSSGVFSILRSCSVCSSTRSSFIFFGIERDISSVMIIRCWIRMRLACLTVFRMDGTIGHHFHDQFFSKSVRCSTRVFSITYFTFLIGVKMASTGIYPKCEFFSLFLQQAHNRGLYQW